MVSISLVSRHTKRVGMGVGICMLGLCLSPEARNLALGGLFLFSNYRLCFTPEAIDLYQVGCFFVFRVPITNLVDILSC